MAVRTIAALFLVLGVPVAASAQSPAQVPTVAVMDFNAFSLTPGEDAEAVGRGLAAMIATELADRPGVRVIDRQEIEDLVRTRQLALSGRVDDSRALQLGQLLGAEYIVVGNVALEAKRARIDLRLLDVATGAVERVERRQGSRDDFLAMVQGVAVAFSVDLPVRTQVAVEEVDIPAPATLSYSRGLDYEQRGMTDRAAQMYRRALELAPGHERAVEALDRIGKGGRS